MRRLFFLCSLAPVLGGCAASTLIDVATAPVRVASKAVDLTTTSQSEADEQRGRELRKLEQRYGELDRELRKEDHRCAEGRRDSCINRDEIAAEMAIIRRQLPFEAD